MKNKIKILCGTSGSGKDYILKHLVDNYGYKTLISCTTRPSRPNEKDGIDYLFETKETFKSMIKHNMLIEYRSYKTICNGEKTIWYYGLPKRKLDLNNEKYVVVLDLKGAESFVNYYGKDNCETYFIECSVKEREKRAKERGGYEEEEFLRRLVADEEDFSKEKVNEICDKRIVNENRDINDVVKEIIG